MKIAVQFFSYFRELTGCARFEAELPAGSSLGELIKLVHEKFPRLKEMERSTLFAVGLEYQKQDYILSEGDEVSLFPPVQGG